MRVIVVGGGIIGLLTARSLALAGAEVKLVERGAVGREASWAGGGILAPLYPWHYPEAVNALARASRPMYDALAEELQGRGAGDPELVESGLLILDPEEVEPGVAWASRAGVPVERLGVAEVACREPELRAASGLLFPTTAQLRNPRLLRALAEDLRRLRVEVIEGEPVHDLMLDRRRCEGVRLPTRGLRADAVVLAAGSWIPELLQGTTPIPRLRPVKGQMLLFDAPGMLRHIVLRSGRYLIPRRDGRLLVGSTMEEVGFDKRPTDAAREELEAAACGLLPALHARPLLAHWAGLRPASPNGVPYIGPHPEVAGLYVNAGHFRNGLCTAPASALLLTDLILGRPPGLDAAPYAWTGR